MNWSSFQLGNSTSPLGVIDRAIAPSARMLSILYPQAEFLKDIRRCHGIAMRRPSDFFNGSRRSCRVLTRYFFGGARSSEKNSEIRIERALTRQPLVKGERLVRCAITPAMHFRCGFALEPMAIHSEMSCALCSGGFSFRLGKRPIDKFVCILRRSNFTRNPPENIQNLFSGTPKGSRTQQQ